MKALKTVSRILSGAESGVVAILLTLMICLAFLQVILRNFFNTGFMWADPFLRHLVLWVGFLGASLATRDERHINLDIVTRFTSSRITDSIRLLTNLFAATVTAVLANAGWTFLLNEAKDEVLFSIGQTGFPARWFQLIIPIGFGLMAFRFFIRAIEHAADIIHPPAAPSPPINVPTIDL